MMYFNRKKIRFVDVFAVRRRFHSDKKMVMMLFLSVPDEFLE